MERHLTKEAKAFKQRFVQRVAPQYQPELARLEVALQDPNTVLEVGADVVFHIDKLVAKTWPKSAKNRFKVVDADNRGKLAFDALCTVVGHDDRMFFSSGTSKVAGDEEGVRIYICPLGCEAFNIPRVGSK